MDTSERPPDIGEKSSLQSLALRKYLGAQWSRADSGAEPII